MVWATKSNSDKTVVNTKRLCKYDLVYNESFELYLFKKLLYEKMP